MALLLKFHQIYSSKKDAEDMHMTQKPLFPQMEMAKKPLPKKTISCSTENFSKNE